MTTMSTPDQDAFAKVIAQAWTDEGYKQRLTDDPRAVLGEAGVSVPEGMQVHVMENSKNVTHLVIPAAPAEGEISEDDLGKVSGGTVITLCGSVPLCW